MTSPSPDGGREGEVLACRVYTHGRRHPVVIGNIQGLRIPPVTPAQLGVLVGTLVLLVVSRPVWAHAGEVLNGIILLGVPIGLAWAVRAVRMEGRAPWRAGLGWLSLLAAPRCGVRHGRADRQGRRPARCRTRTWVTGPVTGSGRAGRGVL